MSNLPLEKTVVYAATGTPQGEIDEPEREALLGTVDTLDAELGCDFFPRCTKSASVHFQAGSVGSPLGGGGRLLVHTIHELR